MAVKQHVQIYKKDYGKSFKKRLVLSDVYFEQSARSIVGLGGNQVSTFIKFLRLHGFDNITLYEFDRTIFAKNAFQACHLGIDYYADDIRTEKYIRKGVFYDLDFTASIKKDYIQDAIRKFKTNFVLTVSTRLGKVVGNRDAFRETIIRFLKARNEYPIGRRPLAYWLNAKGEHVKGKGKKKGNGIIPVYYVTSNKDTYKVYIYKDTSSMYVITPAI